MEEEAIMGIHKMLSVAESEICSLFMMLHKRFPDNIIMHHEMKKTLDSPLTHKKYFYDDDDEDTIADFIIEHNIDVDNLNKRQVKFLCSRICNIKGHLKLVSFLQSILDDEE